MDPNVHYIFRTSRTNSNRTGGLFGSCSSRTEQGVCSLLQLSNNAFVLFGLEQNKPNKLELALFGKPSLSRIEQGHSGCGHKVSMYTFCGGRHDNTHEKREECYNTRGLPAPTTQKAPSHPGKCPRCLSKTATWDCCRCKKVVQAGSDACGNCEHSFCLDCRTGVN